MSALVWGNPLAWIGAAAVAVPILVHLLATIRARRIPFPTLRFLPDVATSALRARRVDDRLLLALRCLIVVVAVAALAQPWVRWDGREPAAPGGPVIVAVVDTSASMNRSTAGGNTALEAARAVAAGLGDGAGPAAMIEAENLAGGMRAAAVRLSIGELGDVAAAEIVVISDFQEGSIGGPDAAAVAEPIGVRLVKVDVVAASTVQLPVLRSIDRAVAASMTFEPEATSVSWRPGPSVAQPVGGESVPMPAGPTPRPAPLPATLADGGALEWTSSDDEAAGARAAAVAAARVVAVPDGTPLRPITIVWPQAPERAALAAQAGPPDAPWMADVLVAVPAAREIAAASLDGRLLLFADVAPGTRESAALIATLRRAAGSNLDELAELETAVIDDAVLRGWERGGATEPTVSGSDGRWLWLLALALLLLENRVRGASRAADVR